MLKVVLESRPWKEHKFLSGFSSSEAVWPLMRTAIAWYVQWQAKQMKTCVAWRKMYSKTKESLPVNLLPSGKFIWVTSEHLERKSEHVLDCCKVCALRPFTLHWLCMYFWLKTKLMLFHTLPVSNIYHHVTSFFSQKSRWCCMGGEQ